ncbi:RidA family protein [Nocardia miyunensis]|uniref:RidA family protein n=1 Tax=Nocardia miyunensis TaxID=282684 RepID=UPI00082F1457|nr:RidA family protein [Nocardia miyunensis]
MSLVAARIPAGPGPSGPYSPSARIGSFIATSGQCGYFPDKTLGSGFAEQATLALQNLKAALSAGGAALGDVISVNIFLVDGGDFDEMNTIYKEFFAEPYPARTTVTVKLRPGILFEVNALAVISG